LADALGSLGEPVAPPGPLPGGNPVSAANRSIARCANWPCPISNITATYNLKKEKTLRTYSRPVNLRRFDSIGWMTAGEDVWAVPEYLCAIPHTPLLAKPLFPRLGRVDDRLFAAGLVGLIR
jgi:hypothetical protein